MSTRSAATIVAALLASTVVALAADLPAAETSTPDAPAAADADLLSKGNDPVTTGVFIRGLAAGAPVGPAHSPLPNGRTCNFSNQDVDQNGRLIDTSIQCRPNGTYANTIVGLAGVFTAYCLVDAKTLKGARVLRAPVPGNANHCLLSGITPKDATQQFKGARWK